MVIRGPRYLTVPVVEGGEAAIGVLVPARRQLRPPIAHVVTGQMEPPEQGRRVDEVQRDDTATAADGAVVEAQAMGPEARPTGRSRSPG